MLFRSVRNEQKNRSFAYNKEVPGSKKSILKYRLVGSSTNYNLLEIELMTGRHHQIRCQLSKMGMPIKGDLKYGAERSNPDGGTYLGHILLYILASLHSVIAF